VHTEQDMAIGSYPCQGQ